MQGKRVLDEACNVHLRTAGVIQIKMTVVLLQMHAAERDLRRQITPRSRHRHGLVVAYCSVSGIGIWHALTSYPQGLPIVLNLVVAFLAPREAVLECRALSKAQLPLPKYRAQCTNRLLLQDYLRSNDILEIHARC